MEGKSVRTGRKVAVTFKVWLFSKRGHFQGNKIFWHHASSFEMNQLRFSVIRHLNELKVFKSLQYTVVLSPVCNDVGIGFDVVGCVAHRNR